MQEGRHKELSEGQYYVHKGEVVCEVRTHYAIINFKLELQVRACLLCLICGLFVWDDSMGSGWRTHSNHFIHHSMRQDGARGKFTQLYMKEHSSLPYKDPTGVPVPHKVPYNNFTFYRCTI